MISTRRRLLARSAPLAVASVVAALVAAPAKAEPISVTDQYERTIKLERPVERLATIPIPAASMAVAVDGSSDRLAAMHPLSKTAIVEAILGDLFPALHDVPSDIVGEGFMPNVEALLSVDPDLVLQWGHQGNDIVAPLENAGLTVATLRYGTEEDAATWIRLMGAVFGKPERAQEILAWREGALAEIRAATADIPEAERPRALYFLRYLSSLRVAGEGTYNDFWIDLGGGTNAAGELSGFKDVNPEQIIAWDPEVIFLNGFEEDLSPQDVYDDPVFADVSAVRNRRVYKLPIGGYRWDPPNQESPLTWAWVATMLHPERFEADLRADIVEAYGFLYGAEIGDDAVDGILRMGMNGESAHYARLAR